MSGTLFPDHLVYVTPAQRTEGPITRGQEREKVFEGGGLYVGYCDITAREAPGQWHHHADWDTVMYLISGRCRIDEDQGRSTIMSAGDFCLMGKGVIHRVQILDEGKCDYVFVRLGQGESVVAVDKPGPRVTVST